MKGKFSILAGLMAVCMLLTPALAAEPTAEGVESSRITTLDLTTTVSYLTTDGQKRSADPAVNSITDCAEGWSWDKESATLTLRGAQIQVSGGSAHGIILPTGATLHLKDGTVSTVQAADDLGADANSCGIDAYGLTITGGGTLNVSGGAADKDSCGISATRLTISGDGTLNAIGGAAGKDSCGVSATRLTISGSGTLKASGGTATRNSYGINAYYNLSGDGVLAITEKAQVTAEGGEGGSSYGVYAVDGLTVSGAAQVNAKGGQAVDASGRSCGLYMDNKGSEQDNMILSGSCEVKAAGGQAPTASYGIGTYDKRGLQISGSANITATGGTVTNEGETTNYYRGSYGILTQTDITISGGTITAIGGVSQGANRADDTSCGLRSARGSVTIEPTQDTAIQIEAAGGQSNFVSEGIRASNDLTVTGKNTTVTAVGGDASDSSYGVYTGKSISVTDAALQATGASSARSYGLYAFAQNGSLQIDGAAQVTAEGGSATAQSNGIMVRSGNFDISGEAQVCAAGGGAQESYGVCVQDNGPNHNLNISTSGDVTATGGQTSAGDSFLVTKNDSPGDSAGIRVIGSVTISGSGNVTATGGQAVQNSYGIRAEFNNKDNLSTVTLSGSGDVTATGGRAVKNSYGISTIAAVITSGKITAKGECQESAGGYGISVRHGNPPSITLSGGSTEIQGKTGAVDLEPALKDLFFLGQKAAGDALDVAGGKITDYTYLKTQPAVDRVSITPTSATVYKGATQQFTAETVLADESVLPGLVTWSVSGGSDGETVISETGLLTVADGETASTLTVTAQSKADPDKQATVSVSVSEAPVPQPSGGVTRYAITAQAGDHGSISPSGTVKVNRNGKQVFTITPQEGFEIYDVLVDGESVGAVESYTFEKVTKKHEIRAEFVTDFTDVAEDAWYHEAVKYAAWHKLFDGTGQARFSPDMDMSRAMLATVLYRAAGTPELGDATQNAPFTDVDGDLWYGPAVDWAWAQDIVQGVSQDSFLPDAPVTREQFVAMLYRYAGSPGFKGDLSAFSDGDQASDWAADALCWAVEHEILTGKGDGILDPQGRASRSEIASILMRYLQNNQ